MQGYRRWPERERAGCRARPQARKSVPRDGKRRENRSPQLRRLLDGLDAGDVLMVTRLDRLARSIRDLLNILAAFSRQRGRLSVLADAWADTTTAHGRLMLTVLGGLAEFERELIRARTGEGRERAKARGVKLGRKPKLTVHQKREATNAATRGRAAARDRPQLQRQPQHDFELAASTAEGSPFG